MKHIFVPIEIVLLIHLVAMAACGERGENDEEAPRKQRTDDQGRVALTKAERAALDLAVVAVHDGTLTTATLRFGTVIARPQEDALVVAPVTGRLAAPVAALGASVDQGAVLVVIEPLVDTASRASIEAERRQLRGQIESAQAQVEAKRVDLKRLSTLVSTNLATDADKAQAEAALRSEQALVESLRRASGGLGRAIGGTLTLRAPVDGTVATLLTSPGILVQQGDVLARVVSAGPRWIDVAVPPGDPVGDGYRVRSVSGELPARLLSRGSVIQSDGTRRDRLLADPENAPNLPPGATLPVEVVHNAPGILVPAEAIVRRGGEKLVFVEVQDGRFAPRRVTVGAREGQRAAITAGLSEGDRVVTRGAASLFGELDPVRGDGAEERQ
jgi:cobalt-zinc-cadmium efflux system membrane fusion protein